MLAKPTHRKMLGKAFQLTRSRVGVMSAILATLLILPTSAYAQDSTDDTDLKPIQLTDKSRLAEDSFGLVFNLPTGPSQPVNDLSRFSNEAFDLPTLNLPVDAVGSTLFKLDLTDPDCLSGSGGCERRSDRLSLGLSEYITAKKDSGIDLVLRPRASFRFDDESSSAIVGAVVEIGEDLRQGSDFKTNTWYFFAGADAEALTYSPNGVRQFSSGQFHLQDRIIVGDAQAGVGYRIGDADLSLSYLRREANAEGISYNEDAAALSFTWKR